jgi:hypothetical protein
MNQLSSNLTRIVELAERALQKVSESESEKPVLKGGWSRKQVIGHLIDSASNNHQRFVRVALQGELEFPGYDQDGYVRIEVFQEVSWVLLIKLWTSYNRLLAHVISNLPADKLDSVCRIGSNEPVTLRFLAKDYVVHMMHHLKQIGAAS